MNPLPSGWASTPIGDLIELNPKTAAPDTMRVGFSPMPALGTNFLAPVGFEERAWGDVKKAYTHFADGDVLLAKITPCFENGKAGIASGFPNGLGAGSSEYFVCRAMPDALDPRHLLAWVSTDDFRARATVEMTGSVGHKRVPKDFLVGDNIPLAPLKEQQRIADKLDTVLARVDTCRDRLARVSLLLKRFRQSVLAAATSGRLTEDWRDQATEAWQRVPADTACEKVQSGGTPKNGFNESSGVPFLKVYNIVNQRIDFDYRPQYVSPEVHARELAKSKTLPGDVLMNIVGPPLGKVAVVPNTASEWNINQAIALFRPSGRVLSEWLFVVLCEGAPIRAILDSTKGSVGQVNISLSQCRAFELPLPSVTEQTEIVRRVETLFAFADRLEGRLARAQAATERLTPALLAKAFRGELVPQDPADEPASELLKRLAADRAAAPKARRGRQPA